ncbi:hypothetical protein GGI20_002689 [Coemansia sp. BCRC 34301]|nr:hypothetical protein GGI20_002689 [Coemansia sp. BCRC 34301]
MTNSNSHRSSYDDNIAAEWATMLQPSSRDSAELHILTSPERLSTDSGISLNVLATSPTTSPVHSHHHHRKTPRQIVSELTIEVLPALLVSVAGSVFAGYILGRIQNRPAFDKVPALFIMVPVLLNLKSNIELNMSTRLSTQANLGVFERKADGISTMRSNMELLLLQSTVVGACVGLIASVLSLIPSGDDGVNLSLAEFLAQSAFLLAAGMGCAVIGSAVIGVLISATVAASHAVGVDPDNIGTPIASSFGDMSTLFILSLVSGVLITQISTFWPLAIVVGSLALGLLLLHIVRRNELMAHHIREGWLPLVYAAATSSIAGIIVEKCADRYPGMPALVPVMNGIGGNIGTVFASRLSTSLHRAARANVPNAVSSSEHTLVMLILLLINIPVQLGFLAMHRVVDSSLHVSLWFVSVYVAATVIHGLIMLLLGRLACTFLWARGYDPDDCVNPFITGTGDMLGTVLLALVFVMV